MKSQQWSKPMSNNALSRKTRLNWLIDTAVFAGALLASISGIYFLFFPSGGYRGGRNPYYGITLLFDRHTWDNLHTWTGIAMITAVVIHLVIHWSWVKTMVKRMISAVRGNGTPLSRGAMINIAIDVTIAASFLVAAFSGLYFFFFPEATRTALLFDRATWDMIHTWSGVLMITAALAHLAIHWRWIMNVTGRFFRSGGAAELKCAPEIKQQSPV
jgi:hypothetical protein